MKKFKPRYCGDKSDKFWDTINSLPKCKQSEMYSLGVALQNLEEQVLKRLNEICEKKCK